MSRPPSFVQHHAFLQACIKALESFGKLNLRLFADMGSYFVFLFYSIAAIPKVAKEQFLLQLEFIGNKSLLIIILSGMMIGGIFGFQLSEIFRIFGAESMMGAAAAYTLSKEMAPVISAMLLTGRAGSSMAAEIAIMRVNEQIDAIRVLALNPYEFLIAPRILASLIMLPLLSCIFILSGVFTAYVIGVEFYGVDEGHFFKSIEQIMGYQEIIQGLQKCFVFALIFSSVSCYKGFFASGGSKGVGQAATNSVVVSFVLILVVDFIMTYIQFKIY